MAPTNGDAAEASDGSTSRRCRSLPEKNWLLSRLPDFVRAQALKNTANFWPEIQRDYFAAFPAANMNNPNLTEDEKVKVSQELKARTASLRNWFNNSASLAKSRVSTSTVTLLVAEEDAPSFGVAQKRRRKRVLTQVQLFSKQYYQTLVRPVVDEKLSALAAERTVSRGEHISLRSTETELAWANASEAIKTEIQDLHRCQKDTKPKGSDDGDDDDDDDGDGDGDDDDSNKRKVNNCASSQEMPKDQFLSGKDLEKFILSAPNLCSQLVKFFTTKMPSVWMVLGFMEDPKSPGELMSVAYHHGVNKTNMRFHQAYPLFKDGILGPMKDFALEVFEHNHSLTTTKPIGSSTLINTDQLSPVGPALVTGSPPMNTPISAAATTPAAAVAITPTTVAPSPPTPTARLCSFPAAVAQSTISNDMIDPILLAISDTSEPPLIDVRTMMFGGAPSPNLMELPNESGSTQKDDSSVGNKRRAAVIDDRENIFTSASRPAKRKKAKSKAVPEGNTEAIPTARPSRANAGGRYKEVRDQVKSGKKGRKGKSV